MTSSKTKEKLESYIFSNDKMENSVVAENAVMCEDSSRSNSGEMSVGSICDGGGGADDEDDTKIEEHITSEEAVIPDIPETAVESEKSKSSEKIVLNLDLEMYDRDILSQALALIQQAKRGSKPVNPTVVIQDKPAVVPVEPETVSTTAVIFDNTLDCTCQSSACLATISKDHEASITEVPSLNSSLHDLSLCVPSEATVNLLDDERETSSVVKVTDEADASESVTQDDIVPCTVGKRTCILNDCSVSPKVLLSRISPTMCRQQRVHGKAKLHRLNNEKLATKKLKPSKKFSASKLLTQKSSESDASDQLLDKMPLSTVEECIANVVSDTVMFDLELESNRHKVTSSDQHSVGSDTQATLTSIEHQSTSVVTVENDVMKNLLECTDHFEQLNMDDTVSSSTSQHMQMAQSTVIQPQQCKTPPCTFGETTVTDSSLDLCDGKIVAHKESTVHVDNMSVQSVSSTVKPTISDFPSLFHENVDMDHMKRDLIAAGLAVEEFGDKVPPLATSMVEHNINNNRPSGLMSSAENYTKKPKKKKKHKHRSKDSDGKKSASKSTKNSSSKRHKAETVDEKQKKLNSGVLNGLQVTTVTKVHHSKKHHLPDDSDMEKCSLNRTSSSCVDKNQISKLPTVGKSDASVETSHLTEIDIGSLVFTERSSSLLKPLKKMCQEQMPSSHQRNSRESNAESERSKCEKQKSSDHHISKENNCLRTLNAIDGKCATSLTIKLSRLHKVKDVKLRGKSFVVLQKMHPALLKRLTQRLKVKIKSRDYCASLTVDKPKIKEPATVSENVKVKRPKPLPVATKPTKTLDEPVQHTTSKSKSEEKRKRKRVVMSFSAFQEKQKAASKLLVQNNTPTTNNSVPLNNNLTSENVSQDIYSSFDACPMKLGVTSDDFLMNGMETDVLDTTVSAFAGDDDVLLQARQVGEPTETCQRLLATCDSTSAAAKDKEVEDQLQVEYGDNGVWTVGDPLNTLSTWPNDVGPSLNGIGYSNDVDQMMFDAKMALDDSLLAICEENSLREFANLLEDCDFRGEVPLEKSASVVDLYKETPPTQHEELHVKICTPVGVYLNHSPVKLSPHNVMLSSSVCDTNCNAVLAAGDAIVVKESTEIVRREKSNNLKLGKPDSFTNDDVMGFSGTSMDSKVNLTAAPFAMTTDTDLTGPQLCPRTSPTSMEAHALSKESYKSAGSKSFSPAVAFTTCFQQATDPKVLEKPYSNNLSGGAFAMHTQNMTWNFGKIRETNVCQKENGILNETKVHSKQQQQHVVKTRSAMPDSFRKRSHYDSLEARIAKELGTMVADQDVLSIMAPSLHDDSVLVDDGVCSPLVKLQDRSKVVSPSLIEKMPLQRVPELSLPVAVSEQTLALSKMKPSDLMEMFQKEVDQSSFITALDIFNLLQSKVLLPLKTTMFDSLLSSVLKYEKKMEMSFVSQLFQTVTKLVPLYSDNINHQIHLLRCMFTIFKRKCHHLHELHNFVHGHGSESGIFEIYNDVLLAAINANLPEMLHLYQDGIGVGMEICNIALRSLLTVFQSYQLTSLAVELYYLGCCMGVYPRIRTDWPHCLKLKSCYSESEIEIMLKEFLYKLAVNYKLNDKMYRQRCFSKDDKFTIFIKVEVMQDVCADRIHVLKSIDWELTAACDRIVNVIRNKIDAGVSEFIFRKRKDRLIAIKRRETIQLMGQILSEVNRKHCKSKENELKQLTGSQA